MLWLIIFLIMALLAKFYLDMEAAKSARERKLKSIAKRRAELAREAKQRAEEIESEKND